MKLTPELDSQEAAEASSEKAALSAELKALNQQLLALPAVERIKWASETYGTGLVLSSSFGIQSAVTLHLVTSILPKIPVVLIDTGHLFPETYRFIDELTEKLDLNLKIYRALHSPAWQEARYGKLFEQGLEGIVQYNQINKVEPMQRALQELNATAWIAGLRWQQSESRKELHVTGKQNGRTKILPIIDWTNKQIHDYLKAHDLPYHPLWEQGYVSVGDVHTTRKLEEGMTEEETRFFGLKRECGLHEPGPGDFTI